jgi:hypothetical protein
MLPLPPLPGPEDDAEATGPLERTAQLQGDSPTLLQEIEKATRASTWRRHCSRPRTGLDMPRSRTAAIA